MIAFQKLFSARIFALLSVLLLVGWPPAAGVVLASAPAAPGAGTVNHYYNTVDSSDGYNIIDNQSTEKDKYTFFDFPDDTFHSTLGAALTYTASGNPSWLTWRAADRTFFGTPKDMPGNPLVAEYTITVTANDGFSTDLLSFTLKIANVSDSGQHVPIYAGDPSGEFFISNIEPPGTPLSPNTPVAATDLDSNITGYRFVAPTGITIPFSIDANGTITAGANLLPGKYDYTVEAYDATGYQDTSHVIINVLLNSIQWSGATSTDWYTLSNWEPLIVGQDVVILPDARIHVQIPAGTVNQPVINAPAISRSLTLEAGATLTMNADLTLSGPLTLYSHLNTGAATLILSGAKSQVVNNSGEVIGNVRRTTLLTGSVSSFGHRDTHLTFHGGTGLSEATVKLIASAPAGSWTCALARTYQVTVPDWTPGMADLRLRYTPAEGACSTLKLYRAPSGTADWSEVAGATSGGTSPNFYIAVDGLDSLSGYDYALGDGFGPTAVALQAFQARSQSGFGLWMAAILVFLFSCISLYRRINP